MKAQIDWPLFCFFGIKRNDKEHEVFTRPPTSCKDLNAVGHTLDGIYLIPYVIQTIGTGFKYQDTK